MTTKHDPPNPSSDDLAEKDADETAAASAAAAARAAEAAGDQATVEWRGLTISFSRSWRDWSYDMVQGIMSGNAIQAVNGVLEDQPLEVRVAYRNLAPRGRDMEELYEAMATELGMRSGD